MSTNRITVFTKPWKDLSIEQLADLVADIGADGIELPIRDGYQVEPENMASMLPVVRSQFDEKNLTIASVATALTADTIKILGDNGIPLLRICVPIDMTKGYMASVHDTRERIRELGPLLESASVRVGIQNHYGTMIGSALGITHLIDDLSPKTACAVLDFAHCALDGEPAEMAVDIVGKRLGMVNFKNACRVRTNGPDEPEAQWKVLWTTARHGGYSWAEAVKVLKEVGYSGDICLPAEYGNINTSGQLMGEEVIPRIRQDIVYVRSLMEG
jgi:sugar phosphate isomerase/epimerase